MVGQLYHLQAMNERSNIEIRILPLDRRKYTIALEGRFILLEFPHQNWAVQVESYWSTSMLTNPRAVRGYQDAVDAIRCDALGPDESAKCIVRIAQDMETKV
jgi:hypothetical protein